MTVLVQDVPRMLHDIVVDAISTQSDVDVIDQESLGISPDVAIVGSSNPDNAARPGQLLSRWPRCRVLMIAMSGRTAVLYEMQPRKHSLGELTMERLIDAIRTVPGDRTFRED